MRRADDAGHAGVPDQGARGAAETDEQLLARLRAGDEAAFVTLVGRYNGWMIRLARSYVSSYAVAEEAVQETWMGVVRGIERFEGRSSFKTWLFRILVRRARTAGAREPRHDRLPDDEPAVEASRFGAGGEWLHPPLAWESAVDDRLVASGWTKSLSDALLDLPSRQRQVVILRDVEDLGAGEVCDVLGISAGNQRVLLHRGRSRLRTALERQLGTSGR